MRDADYFALYASFFPEYPDDGNPMRAAAIADEMRAIATAESDEAAAAVVVDWWTWPAGAFATALDFVRAVRARLGVASPGSAIRQRDRAEREALGRMRQFLVDVAAAGDWEYGNGNAMTADAQIAARYLERAIRDLERDEHLASGFGAGELEMTEGAALPESAALLVEIADPATPPMRRLAIGDRLAEIGDPRPGVGLRPDGLPDIDWIEIPGGPFRYQEGEARELPTFWIARYPVTNAQFQAFIADGGYRDARWWPHPYRVEPQAPTWPQPNRARTDVNWFESLAFCRWLNARLGFAQGTIRLPTEVEWEKAARGTDGRVYPWGRTYRFGLANLCDPFVTAEGDDCPSLRQTTGVGLFPHGDAPCGAADMSGTVWEWCANAVRSESLAAPDTSLGYVATRGGCWASLNIDVRTNARRYHHSTCQNRYIGFRVLSLARPRRTLSA